jgi:hypothetical protein
MTRKKLLLFILSLSVVLSLLIGSCNLPIKNTPLTETPGAVTLLADGSDVVITPSATPDLNRMSAAQRYVYFMTTTSLAQSGSPSLASLQSNGDSAKQDVDYFKQAFNKAAKDKKIGILTSKAVYGQRGLLSGEKIDQVYTFHFSSGMGGAFVLTHDKTSRRAYFTDPQGAVYGLYLLAQTSAGETFFESDIAKAATILSAANLTSVNWLVARQVTAEDWGLFNSEQKRLVQSQYFEVRSNSQSEQISDAVQADPVWMLMPLLLWNQSETSTAFINPSSLAVQIEPFTAQLQRGVMLGLPAGLVESSQFTQTAFPTEKPAAKPSPTPKNAKPTESGAESITSDLQDNMDAFENGEVLITDESLFHSADNSVSPLGIPDASEVGLNWGSYVQGVYQGSFDIEAEGSTSKVRIIVLGFADNEGNRYFVPFQLGVDLEHPVIIQYDPARTVSLLDNERPVTLKAADALGVLAVNLNEPVLVFLMRAAPPFPLSDSDGYYIDAHTRQYSVADQALRVIKNASRGNIKEMTLPEFVNTLLVQDKLLPLVENLIVPNKPPQ